MQKSMQHIKNGNGKRRGDAAGKTDAQEEAIIAKSRRHTRAVRRTGRTAQEQPHSTRFLSDYRPIGAWYTYIRCILLRRQRSASEIVPITSILSSERTIFGGPHIRDAKLEHVGFKDARVVRVVQREENRTNRPPHVRNAPRAAGAAAAAWLWQLLADYYRSDVPREEEMRLSVTSIRSNRFTESLIARDFTATFRWRFTNSRAIVSRDRSRDREPRLRDSAKILRKFRGRDIPIRQNDVYVLWIGIFVSALASLGGISARRALIFYLWRDSQSASFCSASHLYFLSK